MNKEEITKEDILNVTGSMFDTMFDYVENSDKEIEQLYMETLREFAGVCSSMFSHIGQITSEKEKALQAGDNKSAEVLETIGNFASDVFAYAKVMPPLACDVVRSAHSDVLCFAQS